MLLSILKWVWIVRFYLSCCLIFVYFLNLEGFGNEQLFLQATCQLLS